MKIATSLLQAIAVAVTIGTASSCSIVKEVDEQSENCDETCAESCIGDHRNKNEVYYDCPGCGMG